MSSDISRRVLLRGTGPAVLAGLAGCLVNTSNDEGSGDGGDADDGPGTGDGGDGGDGGDVGDGGDGGGPPPGGPRTFSVEIVNDVTKNDLENMGGSDVESDEPARVHVEASRSVRYEEDPILFERDLELPPSTAETIEDAFTAENDGDTYVVRASVAAFNDWEGDGPDLGDSLLFTHGGFGAPEDDTLEVRVFDSQDGSFLLPEVVIS